MGKIKIKDMDKKEEIKARLRYAFPYSRHFESDDKDDWFYLVREQDLDRAVESIALFFEEESPSDIEAIIDKRVTQHEQFAGKALDEILATGKKILVLLEDRPVEVTGELPRDFGKVVLEETSRPVEFERWKPEKDKRFWYVGSDGEVYSSWVDYTIQDYDWGNCFKTKEQAEQARDAIQDLLANLNKNGPNPLEGFY